MAFATGPGSVALIASRHRNDRQSAFVLGPASTTPYGFHSFGMSLTWINSHDARVDRCQDLPEIWMVLVALTRWVRLRLRV